jgi:HPt (histidine-containing phosphotransfer) domain-containing protein
MGELRLLRECKVKSIKQRHRTARNEAPYDEFREIRDAFYTRLKGDRLRLVALGATLTSADGDPASLFEELRLCAHRLHGTAAILDMSEIEAAADALEQAAVAAQVTHADKYDPAIWSALVGLVDLLSFTCV